MRIAVCDDEPEAAERNRRITEASLISAGIGFETERYTNSTSLLADIADDHFFYDIIVLDIEMPDVSGMEIAKQARVHLPEVRVILTTSHLEYAIDAFELSVFRYVPKAQLEERLGRAVVDAARLCEIEAGREYIIRSGGRLEKLPYRDILYIRRDGGKNSVIRTSAGTSAVRKNLRQVYEELGAPEFVFVDRGTIANLVHIMKIHAGEAVLRNSEVLPISRSHLRTVKEQINRYWGGHIGSRPGTR